MKFSACPDVEKPSIFMMSVASVRYLSELLDKLDDLLLLLLSFELLLLDLEGEYTLPEEEEVDEDKFPDELDF